MNILLFVSLIVSIFYGVDILYAIRKGDHLNGIGLLAFSTAITTFIYVGFL